MAVCNLACEGLSGTSTTPDLPQRKLYIGSLSQEVTSEMLLSFFGKFGEIEEGSVAYDKDTTESRYFTIQLLRLLKMKSSEIEVCVLQRVKSLTYRVSFLV